MSKQAQAAENQADKKNKPQTEPVASPELTNNPAGLAQLPGGLLAANGSGSIEAQATRLANPHWQSAQRQALAGQIGRVQGNRHLQRIVTSLQNTQKTTPAAGDKVRPQAGLRIQPKLTVNPPGDVYEQEADRTADQVMRMPEPAPVDQITNLNPLLAYQDTALQAQPTGHQAPTVTTEVESGIQSMRGRGQPLPDSERAFFETRFGQDFSHVQLHTDTTAAETAQAIQARAFTIGNEIAFGPGQYAPGTAEGRRLLAHELTHVAQQTGARPITGLAQQVQRAPELSPEEMAKLEEEKTKFRQGSYTLTNNVPSTGLGKFDASYDSKNGALKIIVKIAFNFQDAKDAPTFGTLFTSEEDYRNAIWSDEEKENYMTKFAQAAEAKWSAKYPISCKKPYWEEFVANTVVVVAPMLGQVADAHYQVTIYKLSKEALEKIKKDPSLQPRAEVFHADDPMKPGTADFYEGDTELKVSNSNRLATEEMQRLKGGLNNSGAAWIDFDHDSDAVKDTGRLNQFAAVLNSAYPSTPAIPINIVGYAEEGESGGQDLAQRRAQAVAMVLANAGVLQPLRSAANPNTSLRRVGLAVEEATSVTNLRRVSDHEFGHVLGLPDEYAAPGDEREGEKHKKAETEFKQQVSSAGLNTPAMGKDTSSIMSVGVDVLPAHYVTIKEALGRMTSQYISESEWQIGA